MIDFHPDLSGGWYKEECSCLCGNETSYEYSYGEEGEPVGFTLINRIYIGKFKYSYIIKNNILCFRFRSHTYDFCDIVLVGMERLFNGDFCSSYFFFFIDIDHRWNDVIMIPEYLNHIEAALYLWSAVWYAKEDGFFGYYTTTLHQLETVAAFVELFASFGW